MLTVRSVVPLHDLEDEDEFLFAVHVVEDAVPTGAETESRYRMVREVAVRRREWVVGERSECTANPLLILMRHSRDVSSDRRMVRERPCAHTAASRPPNLGVRE